MKRWDWWTSPEAQALLDALETRGYTAWLVGEGLHRRLAGRRAPTEWTLVTSCPNDLWRLLAKPLGATFWPGIQPREWVLRWGTIRVHIHEAGVWNQGKVRQFHPTTDWQTWALGQPHTMAMTAWDLIHDTLWDAFDGHAAWVHHRWEHPFPEQSLRTQPPALIAMIAWHRRYQQPIPETWWAAGQAALSDPIWWSAATHGWQRAWDRLFWEHVKGQQWALLLPWWDRFGLLDWLIPAWREVSNHPASLKFRPRLLRLSATNRHPAMRLAALFQELPLPLGSHAEIAADRWDTWAQTHHIPPGTRSITRLLILYHDAPPQVTGPTAAPLRDAMLFGRWKTPRRSWAAYRLALRWRERCLLDRSALPLHRWLDLRTENQKRIYRPSRRRVQLHDLPLDSGFFLELGHVPTPSLLTYLRQQVQKRHVRPKRRDLMVYAAWRLYGPAWIDRFPALVQDLYRQETDLSSLFPPTS